jgi:hypothetical protein
MLRSSISKHARITLRNPKSSFADFKYFVFDFNVTAPVICQLLCRQQPNELDLEAIEPKTITRVQRRNTGSPKNDVKMRYLL